MSFLTNFLEPADEIDLYTYKKGGAQYVCIT